MQFKACIFSFFNFFGEDPVLCVYDNIHTLLVIPLLGNEYSIIVSQCYTTKTITVATVDIGPEDYKCHYMNNPSCFKLT